MFLKYYKHPFKFISHFNDNMCKENFFQLAHGLLPHKKILGAGWIGDYWMVGPGMKRNSGTAIYPGNFPKETIGQMDEFRGLDLCR